MAIDDCENKVIDNYDNKAMENQGFGSYFENVTKLPLLVLEI